MEDSSMTTINDSQNIFTTVRNRLGDIYGLPATNEMEIKEILRRLEEAVREVEVLYGRHSSQANVLSVERATIIGQICLFVKDSLIHGRWTDWASMNFTESLRSLEKYMTITQSTLAAEFAHLGTEKVYSLSRVEHLLSEHVSVRDLFRASGLNAELENYTGKGMELAVTIILNKQTLQEHGVDVSNEALQKLTENFGLIVSNYSVLGRLCEAKAEDANLEKALMNIVATGGKSDKKKNSSVKNLKEDVNALAVKFIRGLQDAIAKPDTYVDENRLRFVLKLTTECLELRCHKK
jgi:hypothetical protein